MIAFENLSPIDRTLIFIFQLRSLLRQINRKTGARKNPHFRSEIPLCFTKRPLSKILSRSTMLWFQNFNRPCYSAQIFPIAIMIVFENGYRFNQTLLWKFQSHPDLYNSIKLWLKISGQTLIYFFKADFDWKKLSNLDGKIHPFCELLKDFVSGYWSWCSGSPNRSAFPAPVHCSSSYALHQPAWSIKNLLFLREIPFCTIEDTDKNQDRTDPCNNICPCHSPAGLLTRTFSRKACTAGRDADKKEPDDVTVNQNLSNYCYHGDSREREPYMGGFFRLCRVHIPGFVGNF